MSVKIQKALGCVQDIAFGIGKVIQSRLGTAYELDMVNADHIPYDETRSIKVKIDELEGADTDAQKSAWDAEAEKLTADSYATEAEDVFVKAYTSNDNGTFTPTDTTDYSSFHYSVKAQDASESVVRWRQTPTVAVGQTSFVPGKNLTNVAVYLNGSLLTLDVDYTIDAEVSIVLTDGIEALDDILTFIGGETLQIPVPVDALFYVDTVADLSTVDILVHTEIGVKDVDRGGVFIYDVALLAVNDKGTIFNGWERQYRGAVNVKWFGDTSLEQTFKDASDIKQSVEVDIGTYTLDGDTIVFTGIKFHSFGAVTINTNTTLTVTNLVP